MGASGPPEDLRNSGTAGAAHAVRRDWLWKTTSIVARLRAEAERLKSKPVMVVSAYWDFTFTTDADPEAH
ncbi:MAG: hypothetical protein R3B89_17065 [Polyangiaceae bacterium]